MKSVVIAMTVSIIYCLIRLFKLQREMDKLKAETRNRISYMAKTIERKIENDSEIKSWQNS